MYVFATEEGCEVSLELTVSPNFDCASLGLETEYSVDGGVPVTGASELTLNQGQSLTLGIIPNGIAFSVAGANGNNKMLDMNDFVLDSLVPSDSGMYVFATEEGCEVSLELTVAEIEIINGRIDDIIVYPNPVKNEPLKIVLSDFMNENINIGFYDIYGKLIFQRMIPLDHQMEEEIDLSILSTGVYLMEIRKGLEDNKTIRKVIKIK